MSHEIKYKIPHDSTYMSGKRKQRKKLDSSNENKLWCMINKTENWMGEGKRNY